MDIKARFLDPAMRVEEFIDTFETKRRVVFLRRADILAALQIRPG